MEEKLKWYKIPWKHALFWGTIVFTGVTILYWVIHILLLKLLKINVGLNLAWYYIELIVLAISVCVGLYVFYDTWTRNKTRNRNLSKPKPHIFNKGINCNVWNESMAYNGFVVNSFQNKKRGQKKLNFNILEKGSVLLQGQTGAGKTTKVIIPSVVNILNHSEKSSLLVTDPKGEIFKYTGAIAQNQGYKVSVINLRDNHHSQQWNPLIEIFQTFCAEKNFQYKIENIIEKVIFNGDENKSGNDEFWKGSACDLGVAILWTYLEILKKTENLKIENFNWNNILACINQIDYFTMYAKKLLTSKNLAIQLLESVAGKDVANKGAGMFQGYKHNLVRSLNKFVTHNTKELMNGNDIDIINFRKKPTIIYIIFPDEMASKSSFIGIFIQMVWESLMKENLSETDLNHPCYLLLDEFANLPIIPELNNKLSNSRGKNIFLLLVTQGFASLQNKYNDKIFRELSSQTSLLILGANDQIDAEMISKMCGSIEIKRLSGHTSSQHTNKSSSSTSMHYQEMPYFDAKYIRKLKKENLGIFKHLDNEYAEKINLLIYDKLELPFQEPPKITTKHHNIRPSVYFEKNKMELNNQEYLLPKIEKSKTSNNNTISKSNNFNQELLTKKIVLAKILNQENKQKQLLNHLNTQKYNKETFNKSCQKYQTAWETTNDQNTFIENLKTEIQIQENKFKVARKQNKQTS